MKSLFILQLVCCVITAMLALQLAMASLQVRWKVWRYEISRWILVASMLFFSVHYLLQMIHGLRAQGADVGAAFNILFYTPVAFAITLSIINIESTGNKVRRYCLRGMMAYILIAIVFVIGMFKSQSLHIGNMLYVDAENHPMAEPDFTGFTDTVRTVDEVWEHYFALDNRKVYYVVVWNKLYKRAMFDTLRFRDGKRYEDQFFMLDVLRRCQTVACLGYQGYRYVQHSGSTMAVAGVARNYLERPEYLLEWSRYFAEKGNYLRAEGLLNDAIENLSQKENFDLSTQRQQARYHELRHSCAEVYRLLSHRTGRESMLLRAGLIHLGLPVYLAFLRERRSSAQTPPAAPLSQSARSCSLHLHAMRKRLPSAAHPAVSARAQITVTVSSISLPLRIARPAGALTSLPQA